MRETHDLMHTIQPGLVDLVVRSFADKVKPRNGNADAGESRSFNAFESIRSGQLSVPYLLIGIIVPVKPALINIVPVVVGVKMITHIPTKTKSFGESPGIIIS